MWLFRRRRASCLPILAIGMIAFGCILIPLGPAILAQQIRVALTPAMSLADVAQLTSGGRRGPVRIEGRLGGAGLPTLPGDSGGPVLGGRLVVTVVGSRRITRSESDQVQQEIYRWEQYAEELWLDDGERRVPLALDPRDLPLLSVSAPAASLVTEQDGSRRVPVRVRYDGLVLPADPQPFAAFTRSDSLYVSVEHGRLEAGQFVMIVADVEPGPTGGRVVPPLSGSPLVTAGNLSDGWRAALGSALCLPAIGLLLIGIGIGLRRVPPR